MASVGSISWKTEKDEFLKESEVSDVVSSLDEGGLNELEGEFSSKLKTEMETGLSLDALNLDGRAPLNEVATEMVARLNVTIDDVSTLKGIAQAEGNKHRKEEASKWWTEVKKHYEELCEKLQSAVNSYNSDRDYKTGDKDSEGNPITKYYDKIGVSNLNDTSTEPSVSPSPDSRSSHASKVTSALEEAKSFHSKYKEAKEYNDECSGLDTSMDKYGKSIPAGEDKPEGVQPGAKKKVETDMGGKLQKITYTNPDGSTVEITKTDGKIAEHRVKNRYGYITESVIYNKDGEIDHKNVYTYKKVGNHVYQTTQEQYSYKDGKFEETPSNTDENFGYAYPNTNGNVTYSKDEPTENQVGTPKSVIGPTTVKNELGDTSDTDTSKNTTAVKITEVSQVKEKAENKEDFVLPKGSTITQENNGVNYTYGSTTNDVYFEYDESDKVYYIKNHNGDYVNSTNTVINSKELAKKQGAYIDPEASDISGNIK